MATPPNFWTSSRAIRLHLTVAVLVPTFLGLCAWQVGRALGGNGLSWAYVFEWPFFAGYAIYMWWKLLHYPGPEPSPAVVAPETAARREPSRRQRVPETDEETDEDAELAAYNQYLAALDAEDRRVTRPRPR